MSKTINLTENLKKLNEIASWFDKQEHADVEEGLNKIKEAAVLIKESKSRLKEIENEFSEIQASITDDTDGMPDITITQTETQIKIEGE
jgi:hypothetical protein